MKEKYKNLPLRSGVGIVVLNKKNQIFLAKRIDNPKNFWQMPQGGIDYGEEFFEAAIRAVAWCGRYVVIGFAAGSIPSLKVNYLLVRNIEVSGLQIGDYRKRTPDKMQDCFDQIFELYDVGKIGPLPFKTLPLKEVGRALGSIRDRTARGRIVLLQKH